MCGMFAFDSGICFCILLEENKHSHMLMMLPMLLLLLLFCIFFSHANLSALTVWSKRKQNNMYTENRVICDMQIVTIIQKSYTRTNTHANQIITSTYRYIHTYISMYACFCLYYALFHIVALLFIVVICVYIVCVCVVHMYIFSTFGIYSHSLSLALALSHSRALSRSLTVLPI